MNDGPHLHEILFRFLHLSEKEYRNQTDSDVRVSFRFILGDRNSIAIKIRQICRRNASLHHDEGVEEKVALRNGRIETK